MSFTQDDLDHFLILDSSKLSKLNKEIFDLLKLGELETTVYKFLAEKGNICVFKHSGFWHGINTVKDHMYLNKLWNSNNQPWRIWDK